MYSTQVVHRHVMLVQCHMAGSELTSSGGGSRAALEEVPLGLLGS
jgi:ribosomal protein S27E